MRSPDKVEQVKAAGDAMLARVEAIRRSVEGEAVLPKGRPNLWQFFFGVRCPKCGRREPWPYFAKGAAACMRCRGEAVSHMYDEIGRFRREVQG